MNWHNLGIFLLLCMTCKWRCSSTLAHCLSRFIKFGGRQSNKTLRILFFWKVSLFQQPCDVSNMRQKLIYFLSFFLQFALLFFFFFWSLKFHLRGSCKLLETGPTFTNPSTNWLNFVGLKNHLEPVWILKYVGLKLEWCYLGISRRTSYDSFSLFIPLKYFKKIIYVSYNTSFKSNVTHSNFLFKK